MKNAIQQPAPGGTRLTRAERRAQEREVARTAKQQHAPGSSRLSLPTIAGGLVTIVAVAAIVGFALIRSNTPAGKLTDPAALNPAASMLPVHRLAPNFTLQDPSGRSYQLSAQRGHPVVLEFFAVWCPVCHSEAPIIARLTRAYAARGVRVWAILSNPYGPNYELSGRSDLTLATKADLRSYAQTYNVRHPQLIDPNFSVVNRYGINGYPGLFILDREGVITYSAAGHRSYASLSHAVSDALSTMGG